LRAELLVVDGDLEGAGAIYEAVLAEDATMTRALCGKGALAAESQDWLQAQNYFEKALAIDENCDIAYAGMGLCAMVGGKEERAFELFEIAAVKNPENQRALLGVLQTGYPLKKYNEMERMLASYLKLHPASIDMLYSLAGVLYAQGKVSEAKLEVDKILIFEPEHEHALELQEMIKEKANTPENGRSN
jgi:tetratricopeptide (TPR) repeat protein